MRPIHLRLQDVRQQAGLRVEDIAVLLARDTDELSAIEQGQQAPAPPCLEEYARLFGLEVDELLGGGALDSPPTILFRSMPDRERGVEELSNLGVPLQLGGFVLAARRVARLRRLLAPEPSAERGGRDLSVLSRIQLSSRQATGVGFDLEALRARWLKGPTELFASAQHAAELLRRSLHLGEAPIPSMRTLLQSLGAVLFFVSPEDLYPGLDGAALLLEENIPAILVNLVEGRQCWWRTRMTLAHELGHVLMDLRADPAQGAALVFSPGRTTRPGLGAVLNDLARLERRANAFAASFLAPPGALQASIGGDDPTSPQTVMRVAQHFGLGRRTAINAIQNVVGLSSTARQRMLESTETNFWVADFSEDRDVPVGLRGGELRTLALRAFAEGHLDKLDVRALLGIPLTEALPVEEGVHAEDALPLLSTQDLVRRKADAWLRAHVDPQLYTDHITRESGGWRASVVRAVDRATLVPAGQLHTSFDLDDLAPRFERL